MPEEIPPRNDGGSQDLGSVPMKPDPVPIAPTVPLGGGRATGPVRPIAVSGPESNTVVLPTAVPSGSSKPVIVGLSIAAAAGVVWAAFSGYELLQAKGLQDQLGEAENQVASASQANKALESDLKKVRDELDLANKGHESAISEKDTELKAALAKADEASDELVKQAEKNQEILGKIEAADAAVQEKDRLEAEIAELKNTNQELADEKAEVEQEAQRLAGELEKRNSAPSTPSVPSTPSAPSTPSGSLVAKTTPANADGTTISYQEEEEPAERRKPRYTQAWVRLGKYETGENKGRWYYVAPDGFTSPLYGSRELAIRNAELRAGIAPGSSGESRSAK